MTSRLRTLAAAAALSPAWLAAQQPGWMAATGADPSASMNRTPAQGGPIVKGKPFSATETRRIAQVLSDGSRVDKSETSVFARDDQGRVRTANAKMILIFDPAAGFTYTLDLPSKTFTQTPLSGKENSYSVAVMGATTLTRSISGNRIERTNPVLSPAPVEETLPVQFLNGLLAKGSRVTITIPAGTFGNNRDLKVVNERWYSDELQALLKSTNSDPRFGNTTYELSDLKQIPPDPALFAIPADFRQRTSEWQTFATLAEAGSYWQVMAVAPADGEVLARTLKGKGFPVTLTQGPNNLVRVLVGPYKDAQSMGKAKADLENAGFRPIRR